MRISNTDSRGPPDRRRWRLPAAATVAQAPPRPEPTAVDPFAPIARFPLRDLSGVIASRGHPGVLWAIRDGGSDDRNALYAFQVRSGGILPFASGELFRRFPGRVGFSSGRGSG
jgi:hypothetical protein